MGVRIVPKGTEKVLHPGLPKPGTPTIPQKAPKLAPKPAVKKGGKIK